MAGDAGCVHVLTDAVLEHLDARPLSSFADVLLGEMAPRVCIVTTPNRDFNALFDRLEQGEAAAERFHRPGVPYAMRHHDHRFEWTRREFRAWALDAAATHGYDVEFSGVGGLGRGMDLAGSGDANAVLRDAVDGCRDASLSQLAGGRSAWPPLKSIVCGDDDSETSSDVRRVFGDCSQMAVFVIKPAREETLSVPRELRVLTGDSDRLQTVFAHSYPFAAGEVFPPSLAAVLGLAMAQRLTSLLPDVVLDEWAKDDAEFLRDEAHRKEYGTGISFHSSSSAWGAGLDGDSLKVRERQFAQVGGRPWEVKAVEVVVDAARLWDETVKLRRACHYRFDVFESVLFDRETGKSPVLSSRRTLSRQYSSRRL